jgi:glycosyltransferase involved in cell wall biosynthesis
MVEMTRGLVARGHVVDEICPEMADLSFLPLDGIVRRRVVLSFRPRGVWRRRAPLVTPWVTAARLSADLNSLARVNRQAAQTIDANGYDIVFSHDCGLAQNPAVLRFLATPSLHYCHHGASAHLSQPDAHPPTNSMLGDVKRIYYSLPRRFYPWLALREAERNIRAATAVVTNSQFSAEGLYRVYGVQARVCTLGVDPSKFRPLGLAREPFTLSVGAVHYYKGYRFLMEAIGRIPAERRLPVVIAANSVEPAERQVIEALAKQWGVSLTILQITDDQQLVRSYNRAACFAYTPVMEPWGLTAVEAMSCGTPVVAVAEGGVRESVVHGESGWLVERDERGFAEAVCRVTGDPSLATRLGMGGAARAREVFTWERTVDRLEQLLTEVAH